MRWAKSIAGVVCVLGLMCLGTSIAVAQQDVDSVKADSKHHKVELENDQVRVVRWTIPPGEKTALHSHPDNVNIYLTDGEGKATTPDGKTTDVHAKAGQAALRSGTTHIVENTGTTPLSGIQVEPKHPHSALPAGAADSVQVDPKHNHVVAEDDRVRVVHYEYGPGEKSPMHGHPDNVQVMVTDTKASVTGADGKVTPVTGKAGEVQWRPATQHEVQNTGDKAYSGVVVELKGGGMAK